MEEIIIEVAADGRAVKIEGKGFVGADCKKATAALEDALLGRERTVREKPEMRLTRQALRKAVR